MTAILEEFIAWYKFINEDLAGKYFILLLILDFKFWNIYHIFRIIYCIKKSYKYYKREQIICNVSKLQKYFKKRNF